ncbi:3-hydroxyacyl-ACP dehydratase FabZ [Candidatus Tisiphia endosymbiont of Nemotelus uliginosus]|uniref:3-hydroxyacyl-ACP dehydratase FabZ n=1 Tax=Candidatus Tisiphia endosymbiont of Nemotelus uliginosus TaxID=3077926 RepID=UPI0035C8AE2A
MKINIVEIMEMLPHRYPFLLIDRVEELNLNESIVGIKNITFNEPQFTGHFPNKPVMPGVLIVEAMAQLSAILIAKSMDSTKNKDVFFMSIEDTKFRKIVEPGDTMYIYAKIEQSRGFVWKFSSYVKVNEQIVAEGKFTAMVKDRN